MANFAVAASLETIEYANRIMDTYTRDGDKKEDTLLRIMRLAEDEKVRGTHPELEKNLRDVDSTIGTLIKQINGIVAGQDSQLAELKEKLELAIEEKRIALDKARTESEAAKAKEEVAEQAIKQAEVDIKEARAKAQEVIDAIQKELDQAIQQRDDARAIADEKTASNDLLLNQMDSMKADVAAYKELKIKMESVMEDLRNAKQTIKDNLKDAEIAQERAVAVAVAELQQVKDKQIVNLQVELSKAQTSLEEKTLQIEKMEKQHAMEIDKMNDRMEYIREQRDELKDETALLKVENSKLFEKLQRLKENQ